MQLDRLFLLYLGAQTLRTSLSSCKSGVWFLLCTGKSSRIALHCLLVAEKGMFKRLHNVLLGVIFVGCFTKTIWQGRGGGNNFRTKHIFGFNFSKRVKKNTSPNPPSHPCSKIWSLRPGDQLLLGNKN